MSDELNNILETKTESPKVNNSYDHKDVGKSVSPSARSADSRGDVHVLISGLLIVAASIFAGIGWYTLYDDSYKAKVVGGDAYNFIIYATRGTAMVCIGIVCAVLSVTFAVFAHMAKKN
jgi:hypothetical protein